MKIATIQEIEAQGWSLNPGRYVGVGKEADGDFDFLQRFGELTEEFQMLSSNASDLADRILTNTAYLLTEDD